MNFNEEFDLSTLADVTEVNDCNSSIVKMFGYISLQVSESVSAAIFSGFSVVLRHLRFHKPSSCVKVTGCCYGQQVILLILHLAVQGYLEANRERDTPVLSLC